MKKNTLYVIEAIQDWEVNGRPIKVFAFKNKASRYARDLNYEARRKEYLHIKKMEIQRRIFKDVSVFTGQYKRDMLDEQVEKEFEAFTKTDFRVPQRVADSTKYIVVQVEYDDRPLVREKFCY